MRSTRWLVVILIFLFLLSACASKTYAGSPNGGDPVTPRPDPDFGTSIADAASAAWNLAGSIGDFVTAMGRTCSQCVGVMTCLMVPLAALGFWTLRNLPMILSLLALRNNVRSLIGNRVLGDR